MALVDEKSRPFYLLGLRITGDFGASIAIPVVVLTVLGQKIDEKYDQAPWWTISAFFFSAVISVLLIRKKAKKYSQEYMALIRNQKESKNKEDNQ